MSERVERLPSKIVQIADVDGVPGCAVWALCEDGSLWAVRYDGKAFIEFANIHPPHEPPTQSADLEEAIEALRALFVEVKAETKACERAMGNANRVLNKFYGAIK